MGKRNRSTVDAEIDRSLKQAFETLADEPLPDELVALVDRLREAERTKGGNETPEDDADAADVPRAKQG